LSAAALHLLQFQDEPEVALRDTAERYTMDEIRHTPHSTFGAASQRAEPSLSTATVPADQHQRGQQDGQHHRQHGQEPAAPRATSALGPPLQRRRPPRVQCEAATLLRWLVVSG